jgi:hypothetical protein
VLYQCNVAQCVAVWGPIDLLKDASPETGLTVAMDEPTWRSVKGCDGETQRVRVREAHGKVTVTLSQASDTHIALFTLAMADAISGLGVAPFFFRDRSTGLSFASPLAYLSGLPEQTAKDGASFARWELNCPSIDPISTVIATSPHRL